MRAVKESMDVNKKNLHIQLQEISKALNKEIMIEFKLMNENFANLIDLVGNQSSQSFVVSSYAYYDLKYIP